MSPSLMLLEQILQSLVSGLLLGAGYGLMCAALGLIFGVMKIINFAQGDFLMLGMYAGLGVVAMFASPSIVSIAIASVVTFAAFLVFGGGLHKLLLSRVMGMNTKIDATESHQATLVLTLGLSLVISNGASMIFGSTPTSIQSPLSRSAFEIGPFESLDITLFVNHARLMAAVVSVFAAWALASLINRTSLGQRIRAAADNPIAATYMGVDVSKVQRVAFAIGVAFTALAGVMLATYFPFHTHVGIDFVVVMYAGVVLGGMGSIGGAFAGGLIIGLVQQLASLVLPTQLQNLAIFIVFLLTLLIRPQGLFGKSAERA